MRRFTDSLSKNLNAESQIIPITTDDLDNLPPTLIHASDSEMLFLDAVRYANKANAAGSKVKLKVWQEVSKFIQQLKSSSLKT